MGKLTQRGLCHPPQETMKRHPDSNRLFFNVKGPSKAYFTYRYSLGGVETETSIGPHPEWTLERARVRHLELRAIVAKKIDPVGKRNGKTTPNPTGTPTFGVMAHRHIAAKEAEWKNSKHHQQWVMTLTKYCEPISDLPVNEITTADVLAVLTPIWNDKPETASRLRGRIEAVIASAQVDGWIPEDRSNPARWKNWLDRKLAAPKALGKIDRKTGARVKRGHHKAMPHAMVAAFMARLKNAPGGAARALELTILTASRTKEVRLATFEEPDFRTAVWSRPEDHMKMGEAHDVPLSDQALAIMRRQQEEHGDSDNPHVFPGRPMRPMSNMSMAMLLRRLGARDVTVHGFRTSFRTWAGENKVTFEIAEYCLAHAVGNAASQAYNRTTLLDLRRPVMAAWGAYVTGDPDWKRYLKDEADSADVMPKQDAA